MEIVYFNGRLVPKEEVRISPDDRGFLLADGVYEVTPAYHGRLLRPRAHLERLARGLAALRIEYDVGPLVEVCERLLDANLLRGDDGAYVYMQVTRGAAPRSHSFPEPLPPPTVYAFSRRISWWSTDRWERGSRAITVPDQRWSRVDIKSIALLSNVLAQQAAVDAGVDDVIQVREGVALEGGHANLFAVVGGTLVTHPCTNHILGGITRAIVLELARELRIPTAERPILLPELRSAEEVFLTGTTTEVRPVVEIDGRAVGSGRSGPITRALFLAFRRAARAPMQAVSVGG